MSAPRLGRALVLEALERVADGAGGYSETWVPRGTLWAEVTAGAGRLAEGEDVAFAQVPWRIVVRGAPVGAPSRPLPEQRLRDGMRVFVILAVAERGLDGRYLTCFAREEVLA